MENKPKRMYHGSMRTKIKDKLVTLLTELKPNETLIIRNEQLARSGKERIAEIHDVVNRYSLGIKVKCRAFNNYVSVTLSINTPKTRTLKKLQEASNLVEQCKQMSDSFLYSFDECIARIEQLSRIIQHDSK